MIPLHVLSISALNSGSEFSAQSFEGHRGRQMWQSMKPSDFVHKGNGAASQARHQPAAHTQPETPNHTSHSSLCVLSTSVVKLGSGFSAQSFGGQRGRQPNHA